MSRHSQPGLLPIADKLPACSLGGIETAQHGLPGIMLCSVPGLRSCPVSKYNLSTTLKVLSVHCCTAIPKGLMQLHKGPNLEAGKSLTTRRNMAHGMPGDIN